jgi:hypothetical protein
MAEHGAAVRHEHVDEAAAIRRAQRGAVGIGDLEMAAREGVDPEGRGDAAQQAPIAPGRG